MLISRAGLVVGAGRFGVAAKAVSILPTRCESSSFHDDGKFSDLTHVPEPRRSAVQASVRKGAGGRSSFSGVVSSVFGGTGFIGRKVVNRLGKRGSQLIIPYRQAPYWCKDLKLCGDLGQILFTPYSVKDEDSIRKAMKYSNVVINMIGEFFPTKNFSFHEVHVEAARRLARIAREEGVARFIHVSALNATENPRTDFFLPEGSQFVKSKALGELAVREEFPEATIIRPAGVYGQMDKYINYFMSSFRRTMFLSNKVDIYRRGEHTFKMPVHYSDVASGITKCVFDPTTAGRTYEFVGPHCYQLGEMVDWMFAKSHRLFKYRRGHSNCLLTLRTNACDVMTNFFKDEGTERWTWEQMEYHDCYSDELTGVETLQDLGITPLHEFELRAGEVLLMHTRFDHLDADFGELAVPDPPRHHRSQRKTARASEPLAAHARIPSSHEAAANAFA